MRPYDAGAGDGGRGRAHAVRPYDAALDYTRRGWRVVPLPPRAKSPVVAGWQALRLGEADLPGWFATDGGANVGLLLGAASGGLVDVDCDAPEAARAAALFLPPTGRVSGRASHPRSHYWYVVEGGEPPRTAKFAWEGARGSEAAGAGGRGSEAAGAGGRGSEAAGAGGRGSEAAGAGDVRGLNVPPAADAAEFTPRRPAPAVQQPGASPHPGAMLVELRSTGCQTVAPPSVHPSGERVRWEAGGAGEPGRVKGGELRRAVAKVAACALLARHWPARGTRDEAALALCGMLVRGGWPADEADYFARAVAQVAGDEEWAKRGKAAQSARALAAGEPVMGGPALAQRLAGDGDGERVVARAREWLGLRAENQGGHVTHVDDHLGMITLGSDALGWVGQLLSEVTPQRPRALWEGRLYLGKLAILDGNPGSGKTTIALDLCARVTVGREMPDGSPGAGLPAWCSSRRRTSPAIRYARDLRRRAATRRASWR